MINLIIEKSLTIIQMDLSARASLIGFEMVNSLIEITF